MENTRYNYLCTLIETNSFLRAALGLKVPTIIYDFNPIRHYEIEKDILLDIALESPNFLDILDEIFRLDVELPT